MTTVKRVRCLLDVDLLGLVDGSLIERLISDPVLLCNIVYVMCRPAAQERGLSDDDFGKAMAGDAIEHATIALLEDLADFSPSPKQRAILHRVLTTTWAAMDKARDLVEARMDSGELDRVVEQALKSVTDLSGSAPVLSE